MPRLYKKRMMKIWTESAKFNTSQRLADQIRLFLKKGLLSDLELLEICRQVKHEENAPRDLPKQIESENIQNKITTESINTLSLTTEDRTIVEFIKTIHEWIEDYNTTSKE